MPRVAKELSAIEVKRLTKTGMHAVGGVAGLYLLVTSPNARSWKLCSHPHDPQGADGLPRRQNHVCSQPVLQPRSLVTTTTTQFLSARLSYCDRTSVQGSLQLIVSPLLKQLKLFFLRLERPSAKALQTALVASRSAAAFSAARRSSACALAQSLSASGASCGREMVASYARPSAGKSVQYVALAPLGHMAVTTRVRTVFSPAFAIRCKN